MVNGIIRKSFKPGVRRFNKNVSNVTRSLPPKLPNGQRGTRMRVSEAERRIIQRRRAQSAGINKLSSRVRRIA